ncbi:TnsD family Tn7-like transposition protein [Paraburkholderia xenovorans]|uniref:TnsD family Tn7-like transposition protein n=1 Tax=Paraburkholderia xenovorans TaxID=36873 RepID=UPI0038BA25E7
MAIALLPLMDNETIGSNLGRYAKMMGLKSTVALRKSVFGYGCLPGTRLPSAVSYLAEQASDYWNRTGEEIIDEHTEYRYTIKMASQLAREHLRERMLTHPSNHSSSLKNIHSVHGISTKLRYCSECFSESKVNREPLYWRVDHQLEGVYFCVKHSCMLKSVSYYYIDRNDDFIVEELISPSDAKILKDISPSNMIAVVDVARRSVSQGLNDVLSNSIQTYREMFYEAGFARTANLLKREDLVFSWRKFFGEEYCHVVGMTSERIERWLGGLSNPRQVAIYPNPFMFIAADSFLETHLSMPGSFVPGRQASSMTSSDAPRSITPSLDGISCKGVLHRETDRLEFTGTLRRSGGFKLRCTCGISYRLGSAIGRDTEKLTPYLYGARYKTRFHQLIARGVCRQTAVRKLGVTRATGIKWTASELEVNRNEVTRREIQKFRAEWRQLVKSITSETRITTAAESSPTVYRTLLRNDRDWLLAFNRRYRSWRPRSSYRVIEPTAAQVREAWQELMLIEPPVWVTRVAVLERIGFYGQRDGGRPFSVLLARLAESHSAYRERVISWLAALASEQRLETCGDALKQAGIRLRAFTREQQSRIQEIDLRVICQSK